MTETDEKLLAATGFTREEWLKQLITSLDQRLFDGDLNLTEHKFQICSGRAKGKQWADVIQPSDNEDITLDDFFPTTITISWSLHEEDIAKAAAWICIPAFFNVTKGKQYKSLMDKYYFEPPFSEPHPTPYGMDLIKEALAETVKLFGHFPGKPVKIPTKPQGEKKKNKFKVFCPDCGYEFSITKKMVDKFGKITPKCPSCGCKMGFDEETDDNDNEDSKK